MINVNAVVKLTDDSSIRIFTAFDYDSIMLYGSKAFAKSRDRPSMTRLDGKTLRETSQKKGLSEKDVQRIHKLYSC